jgi:hypothetical protein
VQLWGTTYDHKRVGPLGLEPRTWALWIRSVLPTSRDHAKGSLVAPSPPARSGVATEEFYPRAGRTGLKMLNKSSGFRPCSRLRVAC